MPSAPPLHTQPLARKQSIENNPFFFSCVSAGVPRRLKNEGRSFFCLVCSRCPCEQRSDVLYPLSGCSSARLYDFQWRHSGTAALLQLLSVCQRASALHLCLLRLRVYRLGLCMTLDAVADHTLLLSVIISCSTRLTSSPSQFAFSNLHQPHSYSSASRDAFDSFLSIRSTSHCRHGRRTE